MSCTFWIQRKKKAAMLKEQATIVQETRTVEMPTEKAVKEHDTKPNRKPRTRTSD